MANGDDSVKAWGGSYEVAANFFKTVNVFNFVKMTDWSWFLGLLMTGIILLVITRIDEPDLPQLVFLLACVGLLNIYVFNIGKDVIQFLFFFAVYLVIISPIGNTTVKLLISSLILYFESTVFRAYYILIAALAIAVYCILRLFHRFVNLPRVVRLLGILLSMYVLVCAVMFVARVAKPDEFQLIMSVRDASLAGRDADTEASVTIIQNWIGGDSASSGNLPLFLVNYGINAARMLVPVELLTKGMQYIPFLLFQLAVTVYLASLFVHVDEIEDEKPVPRIVHFLGLFPRVSYFRTRFRLVGAARISDFPGAPFTGDVFQPMCFSMEANAAALKSSSISNPNTHRHGKVKSRDEVAYRVFSGDITRSGGTENVSIMVANELVKDSSYKGFFSSVCSRNSHNRFFPIDEAIKRDTVYSTVTHGIQHYFDTVKQLRGLVKKASY